jgi:hypothetical protein
VCLALGGGDDVLDDGLVGSGSGFVTFHPGDVTQEAIVHDGLDTHQYISGDSPAL